MRGKHVNGTVLHLLRQLNLRICGPMAVILLIKANFLIRAQDLTRMLSEHSGYRSAGGTDLDWAEREKANTCIEEQGKDRDEPTAHGYVIVRPSTDVAVEVTLPCRWLACVERSVVPRLCYEPVGNDG